VNRNLTKPRATIVAVLLALALTGCGAEHGDATFCTYLNERPVEDFGAEVFGRFSGSYTLYFSRDIIDGRLRALAISAPENILAGRMTVEEGRDQLLARCRAIRAL
jgi:hypothetical protein